MNNLMLGQARCTECGVSLDGIRPHEKGCTYPKRQAELMRGVSMEEYTIRVGASISNADVWVEGLEENPLAVWFEKALRGNK